jgi:hypothetical protein
MESKQGKHNDTPLASSADAVRYAASQGVLKGMEPGTASRSLEAIYLDRERRPTGMLLRITNGGRREGDGKPGLARAAANAGAAHVIIVTIRDGDDPTPHAADLDGTRDLSRTLGALDIGLTDHIIIAGGRFYSFADEKVTSLAEALPGN